MQHKHYPLEVKDVSESGSFEGLASVYGNVDLGNDIVVPGAFKQFMYTADQQIRILDSHNMRAPIGKGKLVDTHMGLALRGQLNLKVSRARDVHELMKDGIISGLSIGFDVLPGGAEIREDGVRLLKELKLWEVSTTAFPMNEAAQVAAVKSIEQITNIREYESFLRESGFSKTQAQILARAYKDLPGRRDADEKAGDVQVSPDILQFLDRFTKTIQS